MSGSNATTPHDVATRGALRTLIEDRRLTILFQPIVDLHDGMIAAFEALSRPAPGSGFSHAGELFEAAQQQGMLWELEDLSRTLTLEGVKSWPRDVKLFLNSTPSVFAHPEFRASLLEVINAVGTIDPSRIVLEVTELPEDGGVDALARQARTLMKDKFSIAIDDLGAGTSGLNRVMQIRPDWLKLDREFIQGINDDRFKQNLVRFFVHFCRISGVSVVAEGIENDAELATVIGLGVRYGQGFFLARPAVVDQIIDPGFASAVRARWASVEGEVRHDFGSTPLVRLARRVPVIQSVTPIGEAATALLRERHPAGVVVVDGKRFVGWVPRNKLLQEAANNNVERPISLLATPGICTLGPEASVQDAMHLFCARDDESMADPVVLARAGEVLGIVKVREVLQAAASEGEMAHSWRAPLTGLPARAKADQHLGEAILRASSPVKLPVELDHRDVAFVDIRRFADYNAAFGYAVGDRLICKVSEAIRETVVNQGGGVFVAHLGDDRFLLTGAAGLLPARLQELVERFADGSEHGVGETVVIEDEQIQLPPVGLRVLLMSDAIGKADSPRDVYRLEQQLRQKARGLEEHASPSKSVIVSDDRRLAASGANQHERDAA